MAQQKHLCKFVPKEDEAGEVDTVGTESRDSIIERHQKNLAGYRRL